MASKGPRAGDVVLYVAISAVFLSSVTAIAVVFPEVRQPLILLVAIPMCIGFLVLYAFDVWRDRDGTDNDRRVISRKARDEN
ncbi:hypothetical protein [Hoyosella altamirensis]|uniref:ACR3 family arsenite efflux pump ArsB n=1 Tax=Hoyosella altamirensis TaxID=616997 RepID=A0A839RUV3_9ACTN|nr:hypothetical protein [Hoyosella altamirensis]MBB3039581.1 ACR3 family arsenite efflux pump ArsB [Hoyosella altamirensis]